MIHAYTPITYILSLPVPTSLFILARLSPLFLASPVEEQGRTRILKHPYVSHILMLLKLGIFLARSEWQERRLRTLLTMSGIIIAVVSIMMIVLLSQSFQDAFTRQISKFNANSIYITTEDKANGPPFGLSMLTRRDVDRVKNMHGVTTAWPIILLTTILPDGTQSILRIVPAEHVKEIYDYAKIGRIITKRDKGKKVIMIGSRLADEANLHVGQTLRLLNTTWRIIGIIPEQGDFREDMSIIIPYDTYYTLTGQEHVSLIVATSSTPTQTAETIERILDRNPGNTVAFTQDEVLQRVTSMLNILTWALLIIISISVLVGSIGIASNMTSSILQRKRLIGTLRALGMTRIQLSTILLIETSILTLSATLIGIALSIPLTHIILIRLASALTMPLALTITPKLISSILLFTLIISLIASIIPTYQASAIPPAESVRYE